MVVHAGVELVREVADRLLTVEGQRSVQDRAAAFAHASADAGRDRANPPSLPEPLAGFVKKVTSEAYRIVDADLDALRATGFTDDAIMEAVLATAVGPGLSRFEIGLAALGRSD